MPMKRISPLLSSSPARPMSDHVQSQLSIVADAEIVVEPQPKNTAAAIALAALRLPEDTVMLVCPSDHHIGDPVPFTSAARAAADLAREGWLVSFGIQARSPDTGFGYLRRGDPIGSNGFRVAQFVEKPDLSREREAISLPAIMHGTVEFLRFVSVPSWRN